MVVKWWLVLNINLELYTNHWKHNSYFFLEVFFLPVTAKCTLQLELSVSLQYANSNDLQLWTSLQCRTIAALHTAKLKWKTNLLTDITVTEHIWQSLLGIADCSVCITQTPACPTFSNTVTQFTCNFQMQGMIFNCLYVVTKQSVRIAKTIASLSLKGTIGKLARQLQSLSA